MSRPPQQFSGPSPLEMAKSAVTISDVWAALGLPGTPKKSCRSPFRPDQKPSFSVFDDGMAFKDFSGGETGDTLDFVAEALDTDKAEAARWLIDFAGTKRAPSPLSRYAARKAPERPHNAPQKPKRKLTLPKLDKGTYGEISALQQRRGLPLNAGLEHLKDRGILHFATLTEGRAWLVTDDARRNAQARLLNGEQIKIGDNEAKAKTMPGSEASWPIGLADAKDRETILLVEGAPDLLAVATAAWLEFDGQIDGMGFAAMIGASLSIPEDALRLMRGKRIRIFGHADDAGRTAARRWFEQLIPFAAALDYWEPDTPGTDLNDFISAHLAAVSWGADLPERLTPEPAPEHEKAPTVTPVEA